MKSNLQTTKYAHFGCKCSQVVTSRLRLSVCDGKCPWVQTPRWISYHRSTGTKHAALSPRCVGPCMAPPTCGSPRARMPHGTDRCPELAARRKLVEMEGLCPRMHLQEAPDVAGVGGHRGSRMQRGATCGVTTSISRLSALPSPSTGISASFFDLTYMCADGLFK